MKCGAVYPAPYISDPHCLVMHADMWPHAAFVRLRNPAAPDDISDIFFAGHTVHHNGVRRSEAPDRWQRQFQQMLNSEDPPAPLVGYFAYEFGFQYEPGRWQHLAVTDDQSMFNFMAMECWYQADHATGTAAIHAVAGTSDETIRIFTEYVCDCRDRRANSSVDSLATQGIELEQVAALGELSRADYLAAINGILDDILAGRYYELNFTQRFHVVSDVSPALLFQRLMHHLNPSYAFYGHFNGETIVSASPELFLHKSGPILQTCPIKGSYRQLPSPEEAEKLSAEHIMVVDLARNDLGRISDAGWVRVAEQAAAREFGRITHLESRIVGETSRNLSGILTATLPAASITGNPKVVTVASIAQYESSTRGAYTGNCGILWPNGDFQLNVAIRTLQANYVYQPVGDASPRKWEYTFGAGGAITADSDPEEEYQECLAKAAPLLEALGAGGLARE